MVTSLLSPGLGAAPDTVWILCRPAVVHIRVCAASGHRYTPHLQHNTTLPFNPTDEHGCVCVCVYTVQYTPRFPAEHKCVDDPPGPLVIGETPGGRLWLCTARWHRKCEGVCPLQADNNNNNNNSVIYLHLHQLNISVFSGFKEQI